MGYLANYYNWQIIESDNDSSDADDFFEPWMEMELDDDWDLEDDNEDEIEDENEDILMTDDDE
jgi:hypothetical protein